MPTLREVFFNISNAIQNKLGKIELIAPINMAEKILTINSGTNDFYKYELVSPNYSTDIFGPVIDTTGQFIEGNFNKMFSINNKIYLYNNKGIINIKSIDENYNILSYSYGSPSTPLHFLVSWSNNKSINFITNTYQQIIFDIVTNEFNTVQLSSEIGNTLYILTHKYEYYTYKTFLNINNQTVFLFLYEYKDNNTHEYLNKEYTFYNMDTNTLQNGFLDISSYSLIDNFYVIEGDNILRILSIPKNIVEPEEGEEEKNLTIEDKIFKIDINNLNFILMNTGDIKELEFPINYSFGSFSFRNNETHFYVKGYPVLVDKKYSNSNSRIIEFFIENLDDLHVLHSPIMHYKKIQNNPKLLLDNPFSIKNYLNLGIIRTNLDPTLSITSDFLIMDITGTMNCIFVLMNVNGSTTADYCLILKFDIIEEQKEE